MFRSLSAAAVFAAALAASATADPNPDIEAYCRSSSSSYVAVRACIDAERRARNEQSCIDALASWPSDKPCPAEWFSGLIANLRNGLPCARWSEVQQ